MEKSRSDIKQLGLITFKVLAEQAIELIPTLGPYFKVVIEIKKRYSEHLQSEDYLKKSEIAEALSTVSPIEAQDTLEQLLKSAKATEIIQALSNKDLEGIKSQILTLPYEIPKILMEIEREEAVVKPLKIKLKKLERKEEKQQIKLSRINYFNNLEEDLKIQLTNRDFPRAHRTVKYMIEMAPFNLSLRKLQYFIFQRVVDEDKSILSDINIRYAIAALALFVPLQIIIFVIFIASLFKRMQINFQQLEICSLIFLLLVFLSRYMLGRAVWIGIGLAAASLTLYLAIFWLIIK